MQITERRFLPRRAASNDCQWRAAGWSAAAAVWPSGRSLLISCRAAAVFPRMFVGMLFCTGFDDVDLDLREALSLDAQRFGGGRRDVHDAAANERAAVVDAHGHRASGIDVGDAQPRPERQCPVGGGQFVLVEL